MRVILASFRRFKTADEFFFFAKSPIYVLLPSLAGFLNISKMVLACYLPLFYAMETAFDKNPDWSIIYISPKGEL